MLTASSGWPEPCCPSSRTSRKAISPEAASHSLSVSTPTSLAKSEGPVISIPYRDDDPQRIATRPRWRNINCVAVRPNASDEFYSPSEEFHRSASCHPGGGRNPFQPWAPAFAGVTKRVGGSVSIEPLGRPGRGPGEQVGLAVQGRDQPVDALAAQDRAELRPARRQLADRAVEIDVGDQPAVAAAAHPIVHLDPLPIRLTNP